MIRRTSRRFVVLRRHLSKVFELYANMIEAGEAGGILITCSTGRFHVEKSAENGRRSRPRPSTPR